MKQIWRKSARTRIERQERWFIDNKGQDFAVTFIANIRKAVNGVILNAVSTIDTTIPKWCSIKYTSHR